MSSSTKISGTARDQVLLLFNFRQVLVQSTKAARLDVDLAVLVLEALSFGRVADSLSLDVAVKLATRFAGVYVVFVDLRSHDVPFSFGELFTADHAVDDELVFGRDSGGFFGSWHVDTGM